MATKDNDKITPEREDALLKRITEAPTPRRGVSALIDEDEKNSSGGKLPCKLVEALRELRDDSNLPEDEVKVRAQNIIGRFSPARVADGINIR